MYHKIKNVTFEKLLILENFQTVTLHMRNTVNKIDHQNFYPRVSSLRIHSKN